VDAEFCDATQVMDEARHVAFGALALSAGGDRRHRTS
jgi:hypothetical protein